MKLFSNIFGSLFSNRNLAIELIESDYLKYADSSKVDYLTKEIEKSFNIYDDGVYRMAQIDAEELSEFSFDFFLPNLNELLIRRNITLSAQKLNEDEDSFDVLICGETIQLYTQSDLNNYSFWDIAARNFFRKVNDILRIKGSDEQFYLLYGGNDLAVMLLTEEQFLIIAEYYKNSVKDAPYIP